MGNHDRLALHGLTPREREVAGLLTRAQLFHEHIAAQLDTQTIREFGPAGLAS